MVAYISFPVSSSLNKPEDIKCYVIPMSPTLYKNLTCLKSIIYNKKHFGSTQEKKNSSYYHHKGKKKTF